MHSHLLATLAKRLGRRQATLELKWMHDAVDSGLTADSIEKLVSRRHAGEPLQYILGSQPFGPLNLLTRPPVLIPRPETEHWVIKLAESLTPTAQKPQRLLDLGTGSGCIPLLLCHLCPPGSLNSIGIDISTQAIDLATENARICGFIPHLDHKTSQNTFSAILASYLAEGFPDNESALRTPFDIVTSNPPYIPADEYVRLARSVKDYEDPKALLGGITGLDYYHAIARLISRQGMLTSGALLALEVGHGQAEHVSNILRATRKTRHIEIWADPWGVKRAIVARMQ